MPVRNPYDRPHDYAQHMEDVRVETRLLWIIVAALAVALLIAGIAIAYF